MIFTEQQFNEMMDTAIQMQNLAARNGISLTPRQAGEMAEAKLKRALQARRRTA